MTLLSPNFDSSEFDVNEPVPAQYASNVAYLAQVLQAFRNLVPGVVAVVITSCYRDPQRNAATPGGAVDSQHLTAGAADVIFEGVSQRNVADALLAAEDQGNGPQYSQCIFYTNDDHIHIGIPFTDGRSNGQKLIHYADGSYQALDPNGNISDITGTIANPLLVADDSGTTGLSATGKGVAAGGLFIVGVAILGFLSRGGPSE